MRLDLDNYSMEHNKKINVRGEFINRELSLLGFDERVLTRAMCKEIPLNERMNFLAITGSNLDEFISVRFAGVYKDKETEPYKQILKSLKKFKLHQDSVFKTLKGELEKKGLEFTYVSNLTKKEKDKVKDEYMNNIFPILTPISITSGNSIPYIDTGVVCCTAVLKHPAGYEDVVVVPINHGIDMIYEIGNKVVMTEDIILSFMKDSLFINKEITEKGTFRIIKDGSVILSHDTNKFIVDRMEETIDLRNHSNPIFIEIGRNSTERLTGLLTSIFKIPSGHCIKKSSIIDYRRFFHPLLPEENSYKPFTPFLFENHENYYSLFDVMKERDILLQHPYDSYDTVVKFIQHAAVDPDVVSIKQTLYRVSGIDSPIVNALCEGARNGKSVTVLVEIKARFDEENNIKLIDKLKLSGANVILGTEYLKTHCKMCIVIRKEKGKLKTYAHIGTGNYNQKTAKMYTDLSYFTSRQKVGIDLLHVFNILSGYSSPDEKLQKIFYAPVTLRKQLIKCIDREIEHAKKGQPAEIFMKINSLSDYIMADKIYEAANKGVKVYIICRGVCSIVPRKNLYIKSIVGRFLEHSRVYYFKNGKSPEYYISSADLLTRNLDRRVETLLSLKDSNVTNQLRWIIEVFKEDSKNSFVMTEKGTWKLPEGDFDAHQWFIDNTDTKKRKKSWKKKEGK